MAATVKVARHVARTRPAETATASAGAVALLVAVWEGNSLATVVALLGVLPAIVTFITTHGGLKGCALTLWRGLKA